MSECLWAGEKLNRAIKMASTFLPVLSVPVKKNTDTKKKHFQKEMQYFCFEGGATDNTDRKTWQTWRSE